MKDYTPIIKAFSDMTEEIIKGKENMFIIEESGNSYEITELLFYGFLSNVFIKDEPIIIYYNPKKLNDNDVYFNLSAILNPLPHMFFDEEKAKKYIKNK